MARHLPSPADESQPFILTDEQARFVLAWYTLDDRGDYANRRAIVEMAKGWGKSPLLAALAVAELAGPACFDGWDADGQPRAAAWGTGGRPPALVQIAAVSEDQADNTYGAIYRMLGARGGAVAAAIGIDLGRTRLYGSHGSQLHPVTASAGSREGQRLTFAVLDETHLWTRQNDGIRLADTIRRNAAKMGGRTVETTNAPQLGLKSVAETSGADVARGFSGILHLARRPAKQPEPDWADDRLLAALDEAYGDAHWIDRRRILREIRDPATAWDDALRFYFNIRAAGMGRAVDPRRWTELAKPTEVPAGTAIGLGFDGSITTDETWLVGCTREGYCFVLGRWSRPPDTVGWSVPRDEVQAAIESAFATYRVGRFLFDPPKWWQEGEAWQTRWSAEVVLPLDTNQPRRQAPALDRLLVAIREGTISHDGNPVLAEHMAAAHLRKVQLTAADDDGRTRYVIVKGEDRRKIDGAMALLLAHEAAMTMPEAPAPVRTRFISADD